MAKGPQVEFDSTKRLTRDKSTKIVERPMKENWLTSIKPKADDRQEPNSVTKATSK